MHSSDIKKFFRERPKGTINLMLADGSSVNVVAMKGINLNRNSQFNMWVLQYIDGSSRLLDGNEIVSIAGIELAIETNL
jgi:hypothetical protein